MKSSGLSRIRALIFISPLFVIALLALFARGSQSNNAPWKVSDGSVAQTALARATVETPTSQPTVQVVSRVIDTPTPDPPRILPTLRAQSEQYVVQANDTLASIGSAYGVSVDALVQANNIADPNILSVGQVLTIPAPVPGKMGTGYKVLPDSELVYGPNAAGFDVLSYVSQQPGYLSRYQEKVNNVNLTGAQILLMAAQDYSVNPRLLLAVLENTGGWVTQSNPRADKLDYPIVHDVSWRKGLYFQLSWAANALNRGFYLWQVNGIGAWTLASGEVVPIDPTINAGTAGVQYLYSLIDDRLQWDRDVSNLGLSITFSALFGNPFQYTFEPLIPSGLAQPTMQLPFEPGVDWYFTGGPHAGWGSGSAWAALDFVPPGEGLGCGQSNDWDVAVASGTIVRSGGGEVLEDLDVSGPHTNDGLEQTGWVVLYLHVETRDRVRVGDYVQAGDRIGHPSCEGGVANATHLHLARKYNGEWISADGPLPFVLDGWTSRGTGVEYDGFLDRDGVSIEAWAKFLTINIIHR